MPELVVRVRLPPFGTLALNLVVDALTLVAYERVKDEDYMKSVSVYYDGDSIFFRGEEELLLRLFNFSRERAAEKLEKRIASIGDVMTHNNDRKTVRKLCGQEVGFMGDATIRALRNNEFSAQDLAELSVVKQVVSGSKASIRFGSGPKGDLLAVPQMFLIERTKASTEFLRGRGGRELEVRATKPWLMLLFMGFASSYAGRWDDVSVLVHVPLSLLLKSIGEPSLMGLLGSENGILPAMTRLRVPAYPKSSYHIFSSIEVLRSLREGGLLEEELNEPVPLEVDRIEVRRRKVGGLTYTLLERFSVDHSVLINKLQRLRDETLNWLSELSSRVLRGVSRGDIESDYIALVEKLYLALTGSGDVLDALYYANRLVLELEVEKKRKDEERIRGRFLRSTRDILENLGRW